MFFEGLKTKFNILAAQPLEDELLSHVCILCVLPLVSPVVKWGRVSPGVTDTTVSWTVQANLTQLNLLCQVTADPVRTTEVSLIQFNSNIHTAELKVRHVSACLFFVFLPSICVFVTAELQ